jgi:hypothetical protein
VRALLEPRALVSGAAESEVAVLAALARRARAIGRLRDVDGQSMTGRY